MRRHGGEPIERATQDHRHQAAITRRGGKSEAGARVHGTKNTGSGEGLEKRAAIEAHNSPALEFGTGDKKCERVALAFGTRHGGLCRG